MSGEYFVYMHRNKINGKCYIGRTKLCGTKRFQSNGTGYRRQPGFYEDIKKYGWDSFEHLVLKDNLTVEEANAAEREYIIQYDTIRKGYNVALGFSYHHTEDTRRILSEKAKSRPRRKHTEETKKKISLSHTGKHQTDETKIKISLKKTGVRLTPEQKTKISIGMKKKLNLFPRKRDEKGHFIKG